MATYTITYKAKRCASFGRFKFVTEQISVFARYEHRSEFGIVNYSSAAARDDAVRKGMVFVELRGVVVE